MIRFVLIAVSVFVSSLVVAAELSEKWTRRIESAEAIYQAAIRKAEDVKSIAVRKATLERMRVLKSAISDATKAGDFSAATELQARLEAAEADGGVRPKPKNTVKFGGHEYAIVDDHLTFHLSKRRCEEMGGHLVTFETLQEQAAVLQYCREKRIGAWIGATNEAEHDKWIWITGLPVKTGDTWRHDDVGSRQHGMGIVYWPNTDCFDDADLGARNGFVCEWDN